VTDYVYQSDLPYGAYLRGGPSAFGLLGQGPGAANERSDGLVGAPEPTAPREVLMEPQEWHTGYEGVDSPFHWGSTQCLVERGKFSVSLDGSRSTALSRAERWAIEQYEQARDAFRRGHYCESLDHVLSGLRGGEGRPGNSKDYRLLFLLGLIRLGSFDNTAPDLLSLGAAQDAFSASARNSAAVQPGDSAWAYAAAAWAAYCGGECEEALAFAQQAVLFRSRFGEAQYLVAKILLRLRRVEPGRAAFAAAVAIHPSFATRALHDADFAEFAAEIDSVIEVERLRMNQRAEGAVKSAIDRAKQVGILDSDTEEPTDLPVGSGTAGATTMLDTARKLLGQNTLYGFFEADVLAGRTIEALAAVMTRSEADKRALELAIRQVHETIVKLADLEWSSPRSAKEAAKDLAKAAELLSGTALAMNAPTLPDFLKNYGLAQVALAGAVNLLEGCKRNALDEAGVKRNELDAKISQSMSVEESWARCIRRGACFGLMVAGIVTMYTEILTGGRSIGDGDLPTLFRLAELTIASVLVGAILGAVTAPIANSSALSQREKAELARDEVEATIRRLMAVPLGNQRPSLNK